MVSASRSATLETRYDGQYAGRDRVGNGHQGGRVFLQAVQRVVDEKDMGRHDHQRRRVPSIGDGSCCGLDGAPVVIMSSMSEAGPCMSSPTRPLTSTSLPPRRSFSTTATEERPNSSASLCASFRAPMSGARTVVSADTSSQMGGRRPESHSPALRVPRRSTRPGRREDPPPRSVDPVAIQQVGQHSETHCLAGCGPS